MFGAKDMVELALAVQILLETDLLKTYKREPCCVEYLCQTLSFARNEKPKAALLSISSFTADPANSHYSSHNTWQLDRHSGPTSTRPPPT